MKPIIRVEDVSKQYRLGEIGAGTIRDDFQRWLYRLRGKEDPFLKVGETNDRSQRGQSDYVWALHNVSFDIGPGEVVGIIGRNGAGKSTLLKILSKVTGPTTGRIGFNGRVGSLLEVGTGFHQELSGRENIFLNGAILGMTKQEIRRQLDEIIEFSGCERYIDTPVKRYSSGMVVRLGFAVAAHLNPEVLIIDEVLAVGDVEFQKKAVDKMRTISRYEGRTILFVSHNMAVVSELCTRGILLDKGTVSADGTMDDVIGYYLNNYKLESRQEWTGDDAPGHGSIKLRRAYVVNEHELLIDKTFINQSFGLCVEYELLEDTPFFTHGINVYNTVETLLFTSHDGSTYRKNDVLKRGWYKTISWIPADLLQNDTIEISFMLLRYEPFTVLMHEKILTVEVLDSLTSATRNRQYTDRLSGLIRPVIAWDERIRVSTDCLLSVDR